MSYVANIKRRNDKGWKITMIIGMHRYRGHGPTISIALINLAFKLTRGIYEYAFDKEEKPIKIDPEKEITKIMTDW